MSVECSTRYLNSNVYYHIHTWFVARERFLPSSWIFSARKYYIRLIAVTRHTKMYEHFAKTIRRRWIIGVQSAYVGFRVNIGVHSLYTPTKTIRTINARHYGPDDVSRFTFDEIRNNEYKNAYINESYLFLQRYVFFLFFLFNAPWEAALDAY